MVVAVLTRVVAVLTRVVAVLECRRFGMSPFLLSPFRLVAVMTGTLFDGIEPTNISIGIGMKASNIKLTERDQQNNHFRRTTQIQNSFNIVRLNYTIFSSPENRLPEEVVCAQTVSGFRTIILSSLAPIGKARRGPGMTR